MFVLSVGARSPREASPQRSPQLLQHARAASGERERAARSEVRPYVAADHRRGE